MYSDICPRTLSDPSSSQFSESVPQMEAIVFITLQIFFATRTVLKSRKYLTITHLSGGKYPLLSPTTEVNNCFSIYHTS